MALQPRPPSINRISCLIRKLVLTYLISFTCPIDPILFSEILFHGCLYSLPFDHFTGKYSFFTYVQSIFIRNSATTNHVARVCFQLCSSKNGMFSSSQALLLKPARTQLARKENGMKIKCQATGIPADRVPDMGKRELLNLILLGALSLPTAGMLVPYATFFAPPG